MPLFADASYYIALLNPRDQYHAKAIEVSEQYEQERLVTTEMVLSEFLDAFARNVQLRAIAVETVDGLREDPNVEIVPQTSGLFRKAFELYKDRPDQTWGLTDCASMVVMSEHNLTHALTTDEDFVQAGLIALLR